MPGASTSSDPRIGGYGGETGSTRVVKTHFSLGMVPPLSGHSTSANDNHGARCRCISDKRGSGGTGQQKPPTFITSAHSRYSYRDVRRSAPHGRKPAALRGLDGGGACARWWCAPSAYAAENGLPGEHHFYITFRTDLPGVVIPPRLRAQYPQEMTIVLQHQFWDLRVERGAADQCRPVVRRRALHPGHSARRGDRFRRPACALRNAFPPRDPGRARGRDAPDRRAPRRRRAAGADEPAPTDTPQVVSLDAFRRRGPPAKG